MVSVVWFKKVFAVGVVMVMVGVAWAEEDRWVWSKSIDSNSHTNANRKASSIPGYVKPTPAPFLEVTTYRPDYRPVGRGAAPHRHQGFPRRVSANPFFLGPFPPFSLTPIAPPRTHLDGTTKSRITADTAAFDLGTGGGAVLEADDKYTTLDRLQSERGAPPPLPRPQSHQLGGLHPDEVFYADDDLLIIKGGGFNSDTFEEPSQPLDPDDDIREGSASKVVSSVVAPLPSPHQEYNGNIPAIVPPPQQIRHNLPFSLFVEEASANDYILVPYVYPQQHVAAALPPPPPVPTVINNHLDSDSVDTKQYTVHVPYVYRRPMSPARFTRPAPIPTHSQQQQGSPAATTLKLPHSLEGDTDVNYKFPRPPFNPLAQRVQPSGPQTTTLVEDFGTPTTFVEDFGVKDFKPQKQKQRQVNPPHTLELPHSLAGDTDVNYKFPRPPLNPLSQKFQPRGRPEPYHRRYYGKIPQQHQPRV